MIATYKCKKLTWIDLECPSKDEVKTLMQKYSIHPLVAEEVLRDTVRPKVDIYKNIIYLILHFPLYDNIKREYQSCEIDFILGKNFLITVHYIPLIPLIEMTKIFEANAALKGEDLTKNPGVLLFYVLRQLYAFSESQLSLIQTKIEDVGKRMFEKKATLYDLVRKISHVRKEIVDYRRIIQFHREVFGSLEYAGIKIFGEDFVHYLNSINGEYLKVWNLMESHRETIESIQNTTDSLLTHRTNDIIKILTIMAFVTFPLMLIASIFSMRTDWLPFVGISGDFWIIAIIMIITTTLMFLYFKYKKWL